MFSAHPKVDGVTGEWIQFGLGYGRNITAHITRSDRHGNFHPARRPLSHGEPEGVRFRDRANERFAEILYAGAEERRTL